MGFLKEMYIETIQNGDYFIMFFTWLLSLFVVAFFLFVIYSSVDYLWLPTQRGVATIVYKHKIPAYTSTTYITNGHIMTPKINHHSKKYVLTFEIEGGRDYFNVSEEDYEKFTINNSFPVDYSLGRISRDLYIKDIHP